jgi:hypothetical protein
MCKCIGMITLLVFVFTPTGCARTATRIIIILPEGYAGVFRIEKDSANGQDLAKCVGVWEFKIPDEGLLLVKDLSPFHDWHEQIVEYPSGRPVAVTALDTRLGKRRVAPNREESSTQFDGTCFSWQTEIASEAKSSR